MRNKGLFLVVLAVLFALSVNGCSVNVPESYYNGGTVIITNHSSKSFSGTVWTDSQELFNGTIRAWNSKTFHVPEESSVYTHFKSGNGNTSSPSGYVSSGRTLVLDL